MSTPDSANINFNILSDALNPHSFGEQVDALIIANIRMWHAQEVLFDLEALERLDKEGMFNTLKYATGLNLERNVYMDGSDAYLARELEKRHPQLGIQSATQQTARADTTQDVIIWEQL